METRIVILANMMNIATNINTRNVTMSIYKDLMINSLVSRRLRVHVKISYCMKTRSGELSFTVNHENLGVLAILYPVQSHRPIMLTMQVAETP